VADRIGTSGKDNLSGTSAADYLLGLTGNDTLDGGAGDDVLSGGGGDDRLTGGAGRDMFVFTTDTGENGFDVDRSYGGRTQSGNDLVTDFDLVNDRIDLTGWGIRFFDELLGRMSQDGADVVIHLDTDSSIRLLNVDLAGLSVANFWGIEADPSILPSLPSPPQQELAVDGVEFGLDARTDVVVASGEAIYSSNFYPLRLWTNGSTLVNDGIIWNEGSIWRSSQFGYDFYGSQTVDGVSLAGSIDFQNNGLLVAHSPYGSASALHDFNLNPGGSITNNGEIYAYGGEGNSTGIALDNYGYQISNNGLIAVTAISSPSDRFDHDINFPRWAGNAYGIHLQGGETHIVNGAGGRIIVEGDHAVGIWTRASGGQAEEEGAPLEAPALIVQNDGLIQARSLDADGNPSIGIFVANVSSATTQQIVNNGTIDADIAIYAPSSGWELATGHGIERRAEEVINNSTGILHGDVDLHQGNDILRNHGLVDGNVDMGFGDDSVFNGDGTITGEIWMGNGADVFEGGAAGEIVLGEHGNDELNGGGGNDLLLGGYDDDRLIGGTGNDGLYGGVGDDVIVTAGGDVAAGGTGSDRVVLGDLSFRSATGGEGHDVLELAAGAQTLDLGLVAASGRVAGFEEILLTQGDRLVIDTGDITAFAGGASLWVSGGATDKLDLVGNWQPGADQQHGGATYHGYSRGDETVWVQDGVAVTVGAAGTGGGLAAIAGGGAPADPAALGLDPDFNLIRAYENIGPRATLAADEVVVGLTSITPVSAGEDFTNLGQVYHINDLSITRAYYGGSHVFHNDGLIYAENVGDGLANAVLLDVTFELPQQGNFFNEAHGEIIANALYGPASAVLNYRDDGALGGLDTVNEGLISATSVYGLATGYYSHNAMHSVISNGRIEASGYQAIAVDFGNTGGDMVNGGEIVAQTPLSSPYASVGIFLAMYSSVTNSGLIEGDYSILYLAEYGDMVDIHNLAGGQIRGTIAFLPASEDGNSAIVRVTNEGQIFGDIYIDEEVSAAVVYTDFEGQRIIANDVVINRGTIDGSVWLGRGTDIFDGRGGTLTGDIYGGAGDDSFYVGGQTNLIFENAGEGSDLVVSSGDYYLYANIENLTLAAGAGNVFGVGNELANIITGNEGSNLLIGGLGGDRLHGGAGVDSLFGEDGDDSLYGDAGVDYLVGGAGQDLLYGGADADALYGGDGNDILDGGAGFFTDILVGGAGNDTLYGNSGLNDYDRMDGGAGDDIYYVDTGDDLTFEAADGGTDTVVANIAVANAGVYLYANLENLILEGATAFGVGNELDNRLTGSGTSNWLLGGAGDDILDGQGGDDVLFGEAGDDIFVFESGTGGDVIGDFTRGEDRIDLSAFGFTGLSDISDGFFQDGDVGAIRLSTGDLIVLHHVQVDALTAGDFIFASALPKATADGQPTEAWAPSMEEHVPAGTTYHGADAWSGFDHRPHDLFV